jgi:nitrogen fixation NifU-like protein
MAVSKAYDDLIMEHIKNARGFRVLADATHHADGSNPLCGDEVTVYLTLAGERIESAAFQCTCCGISMASASIMTESVRGKSRADVRAWLTEFVAALAAHANAAPAGAGDAHYALLETVQQFPARTRCAMLPWVTLEAALEGRREAVALT